jgi:hypothetical protein
MTGEVGPILPLRGAISAAKSGGATPIEVPSGPVSPQPSPTRLVTSDFTPGIDTGAPAGPSPPALPETETKKPGRTRAARSPVRSRPKQIARTQTKQVAITNPTEVIRHTKILIIALQEALDYDPVRGHNQQPPALWNDNPSYLKDVNSLVLELRRLNSLLEAKRPRKKEANRAVIDLAGHFNRFLRSYAVTLGTGAGVLTLGVIANLLHHAGLDPTAVWSAIKLAP